MTSLAFDCSSALLSDGGVGVYARSLLEALQKESALETSFLNIVPVSVCSEKRSKASGFISPFSSVVRKLYEDQYLLPKAIRNAHADIYHGTAFTLPLFSSSKGVVTVHDMAFLRYPDFFTPRYRSYLKLFFKQSLRNAKRIITVSSFTASELLWYYPEFEEKVRIIHSGISGQFVPLLAEEIKSWRVAKGYPKRFLLFAGSCEPRKNLLRLIEAFGQYVVRSGNDDLFLLLAGGKGWLNEGLDKAIAEAGIKKRVVRTGFLPFEELSFLYNAAEGFLFPSLYEGFGFPPLEAMACGTPVLCSDVASLPEVCEDAALYCDPYDTASICKGITTLVENEAVRKKLTEKGIAQASRFSWKTCAELTLKTYEEIL